MKYRLIITQIDLSFTHLTKHKKIDQLMNTSIYDEIILDLLLEHPKNMMYINVKIPVNQRMLLTVRLVITTYRKKEKERNTSRQVSCQRGTRKFSKLTELTD